MSISSLFERLKSEALPGVWSKGLALARDGGVVLDSKTEKEAGSEEYILRVRSPGKSVLPKVSVWASDDDVHCDCGDRADPCMHSVAAVVALKNDLTRAIEDSGALGGRTRVVYRFSSAEKHIKFQRILIKASGEESVLRGTLVAYVGGIDSGRIAEAPILATREDFHVDGVVSELEEKGWLERDVLDRRGLEPLFQVMKDLHSVEWDGKKIQVSPAWLKFRVEVRDANASDGVVLSRVAPGGASEIPRGDTVSGADWARTYSREEYATLVTRILPELEKNFEVQIWTERLPRLQAVSPHIRVEVDGVPGNPGAIEVMPRVLYGDPPSAEVFGSSLEYLPGAATIPLRDEGAERALLRSLQSELHLSPRQRVRLEGARALEVLEHSKKWNGGRQLRPRLQVSQDGLNLRFSDIDPGSSLASEQELPPGWIDAHSSELERYLSLRSPSLLDRVRIAEFAQTSGLGEISDDLSKLREQLIDYRGIPRHPLPQDLTAELRPYQRDGVDRMAHLRDLGLGVLLADDMGLGKTLQALCVIRGRTLIVAPTSVLPSWESQIRKFRPALRLNLYYGTSRKLNASADVILTSYGTLRQDRALLTAESWDSVVIDEAQNIKNPESQVAQVVHELRGEFRVALTGTPIENRLDDLWSQVQFVQPGLLGTRSEFQARFSAGQVMESLQDLQKKVRPLLLRRMKRDVAPELPPKTEVTLYSFLQESELTAYRTLLAATRERVVRDLESGGSVIGALEALLRLRQICAHPSLVPGFESEAGKVSSKLELLRELLEESLGLGHSVLIFSQWTSLLDLVEPMLREMQIEFLRLDGSTRDRSEVIERFQDPAGPRVMILSLKAGGVGVTLTKADHVILLDPWWNPAVEDQAADRAHRIGQTQPVLVQRLVARDTVEDRILQLQQKKRELAERVIGGKESSTDALQLTREDLLELLSH